MRKNRFTPVIAVAAILFLYSPLFADECLEGDCENGFGAGFTEDNQIYEGEWLNGLPHGQGELSVSKGKVIRGIWEKGELVQEVIVKDEREKVGNREE